MRYNSVIITTLTLRYLVTIILIVSQLGYHSLTVSLLGKSCDAHHMMLPVCVD